MLSLKQNYQTFGFVLFFYCCLTITHTCSQTNIECELDTNGLKLMFTLVLVLISPEFECIKFKSCVNKMLCGKIMANLTNLGGTVN